MSEITDQEIAFLLGTTKNALAQLLQAAHTAMADNNMSPMEIFMLSTQALPAVMPIVGGFRGMNYESIGQLIRVVLESDLVLKPRGA